MQESQEACPLMTVIPPGSIADGVQRRISFCASLRAFNMTLVWEQKTGRCLLCHKAFESLQPQICCGAVSPAISGHQVQQLLRNDESTKSTKSTNQGMIQLKPHNTGLGRAQVDCACLQDFAPSSCLQHGGAFAACGTSKNDNVEKNSLPLSWQL